MTSDLQLQALRGNYSVLIAFNPPLLLCKLQVIFQWHHLHEPMDFESNSAYKIAGNFIRKIAIGKINFVGNL